jgi:hypothetical protein
MKPLLYADRQVLQILASRAFERRSDGRWYFESDRSIADRVAKRLIAHGVAKKIGDQLVWKAPKPKRCRRADSRQPVGGQLEAAE